MAGWPSTCTCFDILVTSLSALRSQVIRVGSDGKGSSRLATASRELDKLLSSKLLESGGHNGASSYSFARRFGEYVRDFMNTSCAPGTSEVTFGWDTTMSQRIARINPQRDGDGTIEFGVDTDDGETQKCENDEADVYAIPQLHEIHRKAPEQVAKLEAEYLLPLLAKLWDLQLAAAECVPDCDADLFATDTQLAQSSSLRYPGKSVGWNKVLLHVSTIRQNKASSGKWDVETSACPAHVESVGVSPILILNVGDYPMPGGRFCLLAENDQKSNGAACQPVIVPSDESRAVCVFANFATRQRSQLPYERPMRATKRELLRISVIPYCSNGCARWSRFLSKNLGEPANQYARCYRCNEWCELESEETVPTPTNCWLCQKCKSKTAE